MTAEMQTIPPLAVSKRGNQLRKREGGPTILTPRMLRMIDLMVNGAPDDPEGMPYDVFQAAHTVGYRRKAARELAKSPIFMAALKKEVAAIRSSEAARSLRTIVHIRDEEGEGRAADRKVRLEAAQVLLGEQVGKNTPTVNVQVNNATTITPGYVIRLRGAEVRHPDSPRAVIEAE